MYSEESLRRYPFFRELLDTTGITQIHDSLTGLIARPCILSFIQRLVQDRISFVLAIIDLDNFKSVNDNYGHTVGDAVLSGVAADIQAYLGSDGVAGRFGGDEFLIVYFGSKEYQSIHSFFLGMCKGQAVFRRITNYGGVTLTITATMGIARFPENADSFHEIFSTADKALYRGKCKGRNCFIIYLPEKHANLDISSLRHRSLYEIFRNVAAEFDRDGSMDEKLSRAFTHMRGPMHMTRLLFADRSGRVRDTASGQELVQARNMDKLLTDGLYKPTAMTRLRDQEPELFRALIGMGVESVLISRIGSENAVSGFLIACPEEHNMRIWQDEDCALLFFLSRMADDTLRRR